MTNPLLIKLLPIQLKARIADHCAALIVVAMMLLVFLGPPVAIGILAAKALGF